ncbi:class I SAM-dependent methyltransferase [Chloroflexota bacterium]
MLQECESIFQNEVARSVNEDIIVIDSGCGDNNYLNSLNKKLGIGIDKEYSLNAASQSINTKFIIGDIEKIPLKDECCDVIISQMVLEHLRNPSKNIRESYRILRHGGIFIFVTPHRYHYVSIATALIPSIAIKSMIANFRVYPTYYRCNTMNRIRKIFTMAGFSKVKLIKTYEPAVTFKSRSINFIAQILDSLWKIKAGKAITPHHMVGVFQKG